MATTPKADDSDLFDMLGPFAAERFADRRFAAAQVEVTLGAATHKGRVRASNEDHFLLWRSSRAIEVLRTNLPDRSIPARYEESMHALLVADGLGGKRGGEVASRLALSLILRLAINHGRWNLRLEEGPEEMIERVRRFVSAVDEEIGERAAADPALTGMATTLTAACNSGRELFVFHVGDSRAYLLRQGALTQLTRDQTMAQFLVDVGKLTREQVATHQRRHVLWNVIGGQGGHTEADVRRATLQDGDLLLLCTDGLTGHVDEATIARTLQEVPDPDRACNTLIDLALAGGGSDNVTVAVARYRFPPEAATGA